MIIINVHNKVFFLKKVLSQKQNFETNNMRLKDKTLQNLLTATRVECDFFDVDLCRTIIAECCSSEQTFLSPTSSSQASPSVILHLLLFNIHFISIFNLILFLFFYYLHLGKKKNQIFFKKNHSKVL